MRDSSVDGTNLAQQINAIIGILNGKDIKRDIDPYFGPRINPSNKYAGPKDMRDLRYLILLYASKYIDIFVTSKVTNRRTARDLEKVAKSSIFSTPILFRRQDYIRLYFLFDASILK